MPHYIYNNTILDGVVFPKSNLNPLPEGADATKYVQEIDWNTVCQSLDDVLSTLRGARFYGLARETQDPSMDGSINTPTDYLWLAETGLALYAKLGGVNIRLDKRLPTIEGLTTSAMTTGQAAYFSAPNVASPTNSSSITSSIFGGIYAGTAGSLIYSGDVSATLIAGLTSPAPAFGQKVYLSTTPGQLTNIKPSTNVEAEIGIILDASTYTGLASSVRILLQPKPTIEY